MQQRLKLFIQSLISHFRKWVNGPFVKAVIIESNTGLFAVDPEDCGVGWNLSRNGSYGVDEIERIKPYITAKSRVLIVGAHVGTLAIPISKSCKEVIAIEANIRTYYLLKINLLLNDIHNCQAINIASSDKEETIDFLMSKANSGGSKRVPKIQKYMYYYDKPEIVSVKGYPLDSYLENKEFDLIIMDIEGSEYFALKGMQVLLSKVKALVVEFRPHHLQYVSDITVKQFLDVISPHFSKIIIPSKNITGTNDDFFPLLLEMYNNNEEDDGIIFEKD